MKPVTTVIRILVAAIFLASCQESWARAPKSREFCGVIQEIDEQHHLIRIHSPSSGVQVSLAWTCETKFIQDQGFTNSVALGAGRHVCVLSQSVFREAICHQSGLEFQRKPLIESSHLFVDDPSRVSPNPLIPPWMRNPVEGFNWFKKSSICFELTSPTVECRI
jgi:hypothetical protein